MTKKTLVTAALPYINNVPHFGHIVGSHLPADIYARFCRARGDDVIFVGGSDEHGTPSVVAAEEHGVDPETLVDSLHGLHKQIYEELGISYSIYSRTSRNLHHEMTRDVFSSLYDKGYIEEGVEEMFYCEQDERFLPARFVQGRCVHCGYESANADQCEQCTTVLKTFDLKDPTCKICGSEPILRESKNLYFQLGKLSDQLEEWIQKHEGQWKPHVYGEAKKWIDEGLESRSISREMNWGVNIPLDEYEDNVFYVWFDAPIGYMSFTREMGEETFEEYWEDSEVNIAHFLGKDNIPFHTIFWPAILMADDRYTLPEHVVGYHYLNFQGEMFSKSRNVGVFCYNLLKEDTEIDIDALRSYLTTVIPESRDSSFRWEDFQTHNNSELIGKIGNLFNRTLNMVQSYFDGHVGTIDAEDFSERDEELVDVINSKPDEIRTAYDQLEFRKALRNILEYAREGNLYLEETAPWEAMKDDRSERARISLSLTLSLCRSLAITAAPILPNGMEDLWNNQLCLSGSVHDQGRWEETGRIGFSEDYESGDPEPVYSQIDDEELQEMTAQFADSPSLSELLD